MDKDLLKMFRTQYCLIALVCLWIAGCSTSGKPAPVIDRSTPHKHDTQAANSTNPTSPTNTPPVPQGSYVVKKGDTLISIGLETGQDWRDLAAWNNLENPNKINVGQVLRVALSAAEQNAVAVAKPIASQTVEARPITDPAVAKAAALDPTPAPSKDAAKESAKEADKAAEPELVFAWPVGGQVIETFTEGKNKGIDIAAKAGDLVTAAGEGKVVYAGNSLRGYGNLIIIKHNPMYLTAYAHNKTLFVKEGDLVKKSQKIAEAGNTDADRVKLHFEVRKQGRPVDPLKYLPARP